MDSFHFDFVVTTVRGGEFRKLTWNVSNSEKMEKGES